jgi:predicted dehydrogenase
VDVRQSAGSGWPSVAADVLTPAAGGGALITFGVHVVDLLAWWLGELSVVRYRDDAAGGVEAECIGELALGGGAGVHLELSRIRSLRDTIIVECERGTIELGIHEPAVCRLTPPGSASTLVGGVPDVEFERAPLRTVFARQLANVVSAIRGGHQPLVDGAQGRHAVAVVEACYLRREALRHPWSYPESYSSAEHPTPSA